MPPIPVEGPLHRVWVDVLQLAASSQGNKYMLVFIVYLTKWPEVFPAEGHSAYTVSLQKYLWRESFLSMESWPNFCLTVEAHSCWSCWLKGMKKVNTTASIHTPMGWWTDLITLCLTCYWRWPSGMRRTGTAVCLLQQPTDLYWRVPVLPPFTGEIHVCPLNLFYAHHQVSSYKMMLITSPRSKWMSQAWILAGDTIKKAQV